MGMLKDREMVLRRAIMVLDTLVVGVAFLVAYYLRAHFNVLYTLDLIPSVQVFGPPAEFQHYLLTLLVSVPIWVLMLSLNGVYRSFRTRVFLEMFWDIIKSAFFASLIFGSITFILKIQFVSRVFFVMFMGLACGLLIAEKWIIISVVRSLRRRGYNYRQLLIVGTGPRAKRFVELVWKHAEWGLKIAGLIDDDPDRVGRKFFGIKVIGALEDIPGILQKQVIDEVIFVVPRMWLERIQKSIAACEVQGIKARVAADFFDLKIARAEMTDLEGFPLMSFETTLGREWQLFIKRAVDLTISGLGLIILAPFLLVIAGLIKITSPGPVLFKQRRVSLNGRTFTLYKFRSMFKNAQNKLNEVAHLNEMTGPVFKITNDPRIAPFGRLLRKTSIDELPQLFNVFMGQMSLVGPRPPIPTEVEKYEVWQRRRLSMRPGITCLWQANGRNAISFDKWMEMDLKYIDNWSLWLDFRILMRTIPVVLFGIGAR